ncbi:MAG: proline racemase family protein [Gemmatimonadales bacterium]
MAGLIRRHPEFLPGRLPADRITVIESHTGGEPFRVIVGGVPAIPGSTMVAKRAYAREHLDGIRRRLMWEPRGHADMYGCFLTDPVSPGADLGVLFLHNEGFSTMCGHGIIALATVLVEAGLVEAVEPTTRIAIDTPAGLVQAAVMVADGRVVRVRFTNVASWVEALDQSVTVPGLGTVRYDLAFGGAFYAYVDASDLGLALVPAQAGRLIEAGRAIKRAVQASREIPHPFESELSFLYGTIFTGPPADPGAYSRHVCIFADGELDRSPTGTGVSARLALLAVRGALAPGERIRIESIVGSEFGGRIVERTTFGPHEAVVPEVDGVAYLTGRAEFWTDPADPLGGGFLIR